MNDLFALLKRAILLFKKYPVHFLVFQIPEVSVELIEAMIGPKTENRILIILVFALPYFFFTSFLTSALTFLSVRDTTTSGRPPSLGMALGRIVPKLKLLLPVSLLTGIILGLSLAAFILPVFYFMTVYLFVPILVASETKMAWSQYLYRSKKIIQTRLWKTMTIVFCMLTSSFIIQVGLNIDLIWNFVGEWGWLLEAVRYFLSMLVGAIVAIWVSLYYLETTKNERAH